MTPDYDTTSAKSDYELGLLVARIGATCTKNKLIPPFSLRDASRNWEGLAADEIVEVLEQHFSDCRRFYTCGAGEQHFNMVHQAMNRAMESKHPRPDPEPKRPPSHETA